MFLRDLKTERDALAILRESALVLAGMDLNTGELQVAKADIPFPAIADNAPVHFSLFNNLVVAQKLIHPDDEAEYLRLTALSHLREQFFSGQKQIYMNYRQKKNDGAYHRVGLLAVAGRLCDQEHPRIVFVLRDFEGETPADRAHRVALYHVDALTGCSTGRGLSAIWNNIMRIHRRGCCASISTRWGFMKSIIIWGIRRATACSARWQARREACSPRTTSTASAGMSLSFSAHI